MAIDDSPSQDVQSSVNDHGSQKSTSSQRPPPLLLFTKPYHQAFPISGRPAISPKASNSQPPPLRPMTTDPEARRASFPVTYRKREVVTPTTPIPKLFQAPWVRKPKSTHTPPTNAATPPKQKLPVFKRNASPTLLPMPASSTTASQGLGPKELSPGQPVDGRAQPMPVREPVNGEGPPARSLARRASDALLSRKGSGTSIACAFCTATGVSSAWRRDKTGRPLCGKCCDQLRRRMNPRYVATNIVPTQQPRPPIRGSQEIPSPPRNDFVRRATPPYPSARPREMALSAIRTSPLQPPDAVRAEGPHPQASHDFAARPLRHSPTMQRNSLDLVSLPPMSDLERIAGSYGPYYPQPNGAGFAARRRSDYNNGRRTLVSEEDVREARLTLLEGRRWILSMLDETSELLKALENVPFNRERFGDEAGYRDVPMGGV